MTKLVIESLFIYNWSTRSIDEIGGLFHQAQFAGADQPLGRGAGLLFNREGLECNGQGASEVELIGKLGGIGKRGDDDDRCLAGRDGKGYATTRGQGSVAAILIRGQAIGGGIGRGKGRGIGAEEGVDAAAAGIADRAGGQAEVGRTGRGIGNAECVIQDRRAHARGAAANAGLAVIGRIIGVQRTGERRGDTARIQQRGVLTGFAHWRWAGPCGQNRLFGPGRLRGRRAGRPTPARSHRAWRKYSANPWSLSARAAQSRKRCYRRRPWKVPDRTGASLPSCHWSVGVRLRPLPARGWS